MPREISPDFQSHLDSGATTTCVCVLITPVSVGYASLGVTTLDRDMFFSGSKYHAAVGMDNSARTAATDMSVDNSEGVSLVPEFNIPIDEKDLIAGAYDYAKWVSYLVNYEDTTQFVELARGSLGQVKVVNGLSFTFELLGMTKHLKQSFVEKDSLRCRATFGSQPFGSGSEVEQRFPCGFDASQLWRGGSVTEVGEENTISFKTGLPESDGYYKPGMIKWITGSNAGRVYEVEEYRESTVWLTFPTMFPVAEGDTFQIRPDCTKWKNDANGCKSWFGGDWVLHYRGEPDIPVGDTGQVNAPGASV